MLNAQFQSDNASALALAVRRLAREAQEVLRGDATDDQQVEALIARIDRVRESEDVCGREPIARWLESLRRELEAAYLPVGPV